MRLQLDRVTEVWFDDGRPVRAASAMARFGDGWLIAQDDATHAAWQRAGGVHELRVLPPVDGHDTFSSAAGTKHLKPDFEAAVELPDGVLLLGSGSTPDRMRASLVTATGYRVIDLTPVYAEVAAALAVPPGRLNLEGAARLGDRVRWFQRGNSAAGVPSSSVDVPLAALLGGGPAAPGGVRRYELGDVGGVGLAVTDAVPLPDGRVLVSAAAEDTPNAYDDGPVVGAALALLDGERTVAVAALPAAADGRAYKVEGLAVAGTHAVAVVDADDPDGPSVRLDLRLEW